MNENSGIKKTHKLMTERLIDYITSQYFGDNELLINASNKLLKKEGNLFQKPFIESTPSYKKVENGIEKANIDEKVKKVFIELQKKNLGVFKTPFKHQIDALESFSNGQNLFVATGTGSGKTECFIWPIIYKLIYEMIYHKETWENRGVRTIIIYPMNALVSDQIARLRSILGDYNGEFINILNNYCGDIRRPQFGMYTGRTPYPGDKLSKSTNNDLAKSYKKSYLVDANLSEDEKAEQLKDIEGLKKINKYPSKDMSKFVSALENEELESYDSSNDAELLLRYEIQVNTPDILITNYTMLEYMLFRNNESNIWNNTKKWLDENKDNKLLIVLDEAHMYSGASGGEVALLIRRLFAKLGINHDKVQFILTSASMPNENEEDKKAIEKFASDFTSFDPSSFKFLFGEKESIELKNEVNFDLDKLANLELEFEVLSEENIENNIKTFAKEIFNESNINNPRVWLYENINRYKPFSTLIKNCQGIATSYDELQMKCIGDMSEKGDKAFNNLLLLAPFAKDANGNVLFPARLHLFFRGLNGIYGCLNPNCKCHHEGKGIKLGKLFDTRVEQCTECNSKVYELINDRRCGSLFIKTYINKSAIFDSEIFCWNKNGMINNEDIVELPLYITPKDYDFVNRPKKTDKAYFDYMSGVLYKNKETSTSIPVLIPVIELNEISKGDFSFKQCPHCGKDFRFIGLSDFKVKGNISFYSLIKSQFKAQPMIKEPTNFTPNGGRKVLLFSDSRQSAAILARDMTKNSDIESFRKTIYLGMQKIYLQNEREFTMNYLYPAFVEVCVEQNLRFFYGKELEKLEEDKSKLRRLIERDKARGRKPDYNRLQSELNTPCEMYQSNLIEFFCNPTHNFFELGLGYIEPLDDKVEDALFDLNIEGLDREEFIKIFVSIAIKTCTDCLSFDNTVSENVRRGVKYIKGNRYGFNSNEFKRYFNNEIIKKYPNDYEKIYNLILQEFYRKENESYFLNLQTIKIVLTDEETKWYKCDRCGSIVNFLIEDKCPICESKSLIENIPSKFEKLDYWRKPIVLEEQIKSLNTEEHTAQLSYKDQKVSTWSKTEDYEMRFQDVNVENINKNPIDILSCTTTMEVGIDIGSLTAIGMHNIPPQRENYQQRAGRAGRRGSSISTICVYAQGGPHDNFYFNNPKEIIRGKVRRPWLDIKNRKLISRHFNLICFSNFSSLKGISLYDIKVEKFAPLLYEFNDYVDKFEVNEIQSKEYFLNENLDKFKKDLNEKISELVVNQENLKRNLFDLLFEKGIIPSYSFPLDIVDFTVLDFNGNVKYAPSRGLELAINEYAPGRTIVIDKKTYQSGGIYSPIAHKNLKNPLKPAEPYFEDDAHYKTIYVCENKACGWFGKEKPVGNKCPFCGNEINTDEENKMLIPWGFAPKNGKEINEVEANSELTYAGDPCYSATPSNDLKFTNFKNMKIANRKNEEIIILNKGIKNQGFDVCKDCGAAKIHDEKGLKESSYHAPFTLKGRSYNCNHVNIAEGIYLGTNFVTDMFFMQIEINNEITEDNLILNSALTTLSEAMKLSISRILDISYNDLMSGIRKRADKINKKRYLDIYFYDSLSSGAGYSTQIENYLDEIISNTYKILNSNDDRDICNYWNQKKQYLFNKKVALNLLDWTTKNEMPDYFDEEETKIICAPLISALNNKNINDIKIKNNELIVSGITFNIISSFVEKKANDITTFDIEQKLPTVLKEIESKVRYLIKKN